MVFILTFLGISPFLIFGILLPKYTLLFQTYSICIISFLAGSHWGLQKEKPFIAIASNLITLIAWMSILLNVPLMNILHIILFICLLMIDKLLYQTQNLKKSYLQIRILVTYTVIGILILNSVLSYT